jgi:hypothetical protein
MKVEQLSDLALDCIHSAARALDDRYRPAFYGEVAGNHYSGTQRPA